MENIDDNILKAQVDQIIHVSEITGQSESLRKAIDDTLEKGGKRGVVGEIREYAGKKFQKQLSGRWLPVKEAGHTKRQEPLDGPLKGKEQRIYLDYLKMKKEGIDNEDIKDTLSERYLGEASVDNHMIIQEAILSGKQESKTSKDSNKYKREKYESKPVEAGQVFLRSDHKPGYYNYIKVLAINGKYADVQVTDYDGKNIGGSKGTMSLSSIQDRVDDLGKEVHDKKEDQNEMSHGIAKKIGLNDITGGHMSSPIAVHELKKALEKLTKISAEYDVKDSSVGAGGFSGASSATMSSSRSGKAVSIQTNGTHSGGYYAGNTPYIVQIQIGGGIDLKARHALSDVSKKLLSKFEYDTSLGKSRIMETDGTNWGSVMLTAPTDYKTYSTIPSLNSR